MPKPTNLTSTVVDDGSGSIRITDEDGDTFSIEEAVNPGLGYAYTLEASDGPDGTGDVVEVYITAEQAAALVTFLQGLRA